jgi:hypothetical protein
MRRTRAWWAQFSDGERSELVRLRRADSPKPGQDYSGRCNYCSAPAPSYRLLCTPCKQRLLVLIDIGNSEGKER